jgi:hypothetical protein
VGGFASLFFFISTALPSIMPYIFETRIDLNLTSDARSKFWNTYWLVTSQLQVHKHATNYFTITLQIKVAFTNPAENFPVLGQWELEAERCNVAQPKKHCSYSNNKSNFGHMTLKIYGSGIKVYIQLKCSALPLPN